MHADGPEDQRIQTCHPDFLETVRFKRFGLPLYRSLDVQSSHMWDQIMRQFGFRVDTAWSLRDL